ncbi:Retrovirus-related Pol polyprotein from transposon 17.6 [Trichinella spiralis]|uniref:Retrovirus-related Pol polyprotein from transposon 17.6 n=1 Tax=Trichinella spiralis TaxID=6334 RepID=A0ABR3KG19_TRISP
MTDHRPLDYKIEYRKGKQNYCADALSRLPMQTEEPYTVKRKNSKKSTRKGTKRSKKMHWRQLVRRKSTAKLNNSAKNTQKGNYETAT